MSITTRAIIEVLDAQNKITGYELENVYIDEPGIASGTVRRDEATADQVAALRQISADARVVETLALNKQIADERDAHAAEIVAKDANISELRAQIAALLLTEVGVEQVARTQ